MKVLPSGLLSRVRSVDTANPWQENHDEAAAPMSVTLTLEDDLDISRGDMIVGEDDTPRVSQDIELMVCWLGERPLQLNGKYVVRHATRDVRCLVKDIRYKLNINNLERDESDRTVAMNDIARITLRATQPLVYDSYSRNRITGSLILIDEATNNTVGAGMIV